MRESILAAALLAGVLTVGTSVARAQDKAKQPLFQATSADAGVHLHHAAVLGHPRRRQQLLDAGRGTERIGYLPARVRTGH